MINHHFPASSPDKQGWPWTTMTGDSPHKVDWPKVTVVMPSYNQGQFLEEAIRSVLLQDYPNLEFLIYDGGSTDTSVDIIKKYVDYIDYWVSERDNGQSDAINRGFLQATGDYIAWLNSDDLYLPGCLKKLVAALQKNPTASMAFGKVDVIDSYNRKVGSFEPVDPTVENLLFFQAIIPQQAALFRRSVVEKVGLLNVNLDYAMDHEFFIRLAMYNSIIGVDEVLAQFRLSNNNKGVAHRTRWAAEYVKIVETLFSKPLPRPELAHLKNQSLAGAFFRGGATYLESFEAGTALRWFWQAARIRPIYLLEMRWWKKFVRSLTGRFGNRLILFSRLQLRKMGAYHNAFDWQTNQQDLERNKKQTP